MTDESFKRAIEIKSRLKEIDDFIFYMDRTWRVSLTSKRPEILFSNIAYGVFGSKTIECDAELGDRLKKIIREYREEILKEFESLE